jgi:hypothetical protein
MATATEAGYKIGDGRNINYAILHRHAAAAILLAEGYRTWAQCLLLQDEAPQISGRLPVSRMADESTSSESGGSLGASLGACQAKVLVWVLVASPYRMATD